LVGPISVTAGIGTVIVGTGVTYVVL